MKSRNYLIPVNAMSDPVNAQDNLTQLLTPQNETDESMDLYIYGDIVSSWWGAWSKEDTYPTAIKDFIEKAGGRRINMHINSGGGSVFAGMAIYNLLKNYQGEVITYIDGRAASIASVIALAGDKIVMRTGSAIMTTSLHMRCGARTTRMTSDTLQMISMRFRKLSCRCTGRTRQRMPMKRKLKKWSMLKHG